MGGMSPPKVYPCYVAPGFIPCETTRSFRVFATDEGWRYIDNLLSINRWANIMPSLRDGL